MKRFALPRTSAGPTSIRMLRYACSPSGIVHDRHLMREARLNAKFRRAADAGFERTVEGAHRKTRFAMMSRSRSMSR
jgi:hypothetical protein